MLEGVKRNDEGLFEVLVGGRVVACVGNTSDAWREYEAARNDALVDIDFTHISSGMPIENEE